MRDTLVPFFNVPFDDAKHGDYLCKNLDVNHLLLYCPWHLFSLIKCKWGIFHPEGMCIPVLDYECNIDMSTSSPIRFKAVNLGPRKNEIMQPIIDKLESINQIHHVFEGEWHSPALLTPTSHQEYVFDINHCIWCVCLNHIALTNVTKVITYQFFDATSLWPFSLVIPCTVGYLMHQKASMKSPSISWVKRNLHLLDLTLASTLTLCCHLG